MRHVPPIAAFLDSDTNATVVAVPTVGARTTGVAGLLPLLTFLVLSSVCLPRRRAMALSALGERPPRANTVAILTFSRDHVGTFRLFHLRDARVEDAAAGTSGTTPPGFVLTSACMRAQPPEREETRRAHALTRRPFAERDAVMNCNEAT